MQILELVENFIKSHNFIQILPLKPTKPKPWHNTNIHISFKFLNYIQLFNTYVGFSDYHYIVQIGSKLYIC